MAVKTSSAPRNARGAGSDRLGAAKCYQRPVAALAFVGVDDRENSNLAAPVFRKMRAETRARTANKPVYRNVIFFGKIYESRAALRCAVFIFSIGLQCDAVCRRGIFFRYAECKIRPSHDRR